MNTRSTVAPVAASRWLATLATIVLVSAGCGHDYKPPDTVGLVAELTFDGRVAKYTFADRRQLDVDLNEYTSVSGGEPHVGDLLILVTEPSKLLFRAWPNPNSPTPGCLTLSGGGEDLGDAVGWSTSDKGYDLRFTKADGFQGKLYGGSLGDRLVGYTLCLNSQGRAISVE
ncbi:MAG TPA: hypothetical protein VIV06_01135 [Candidatus Limnocylindrales bacterium]